MSLEDTLSDVFIVACVFSKTPIVCACFVVAWLSVILRASAIFCHTFETMIEFLPVINFVCI